MPAQQSHPPEFNDQTRIDPFLNANDSEENLVPIHSDHSPYQRSYYSPTPEQTLRPHDGSSSKSLTPGHPSQGPQAPLTNGYNHTSSTPGEGENNDAPYDFLSPGQYLSDNSYHASSDHTATPEYEGFYLEDNYGPLKNPSFSQDSASFENSLLNDGTFDPANGTSQINHIHRPSAGTATLSSSHLMSPVLTDSPQISTREGTTSPPYQPSQIKQEPVPMKINTVHQNHPFQQMQQTPTATDSSEGNSQGMPATLPNIARAASPAIRIDQYARGDSPARQPYLGGTKRSRTGSHSSHLAVQLDDDDSEDDQDRFEQRQALDPNARQQVSGETSNLKDQDIAAQRALRNADVADWLDHSASGTEAPADLAPEKPRDFGKRPRARSVGAQRLSTANLESLQTTPVDAHIPGPNIMLDESSGEEESEDEDERASINDSPLPSPTEGMNDVPGEARPGVYNELPNQPPMYRAKLWQDPVYDSSDPGLRLQPTTSNQAMERFKQRASEIDTISRVATWGTRRMSESDLQSLFRRFSVKSEFPEDDQGNKKQRDRSGSFLQRFVPKRKPSLHRKESEKSKQTEHRHSLGGNTRTASGHGRHDSLSVPQRTASGLKRIGSNKKPKPRIDTGSAMAAMASPMAALGGSGPLSATASSPPPGPWEATKKVMKRSRSRTDLTKGGSGHSSTTELGLADLWTKQGGPPMPSLAAPKTEDPAPLEFEDEEEDEADEVGVKMDLSIKSDSITPTKDGFKANVRKLNPRLPHFMFDRIAQEQLRRFKKLVDFRVKHIQAISTGTCTSGKHCEALGGKPTYLPGKSNKELDIPNASFTISGLGTSEEDANALQDGLVTAAQFPQGVPMPPVNRLPAEFECPLCFRVKKFQKPSDWSKHVHEDVQPFTCTFAQCAEPKSFKRKADWVRHENERHRKLEWWQCNHNDCSHICYRKDNFVQHLVREHKLPEPQVKTVKAGKPAVRGPSAQRARSMANENANEIPEEVDLVWRLAQECRRETPKDPKDEVCKFCGNVCNSWKKLTVHLAKHMEQISMPVLGIVKKMEVTPDTIISPIEANRITSQTTSMSPISQNGPNSPFAVSGASMANMPAGFTTLGPQPGYFPNTEYQRAATQTYPQPSQQQQQQFAAAYAQIRRPGPQMPNYQFTPSPPFDPITTQPSGSTETAYNMATGVPTSQAHTSTYHNDDSAFQYAPQQVFANSPIAEGGMYQQQFGPTTTTAAYQQTVPAPTGYPLQTNAFQHQHHQQQQQQQDHMAGMGYGMSQLQYTNGGNDGGMNGGGYDAYRQ